MANFVTHDDMLEAKDVFSRFYFTRMRAWTEQVSINKPIHIVAEGSSRYFPSGQMIFLAQAHPESCAMNLAAYGGWDALEKIHDNATVILISNSGKTKEILDLEEKLRAQGHGEIHAITADGTSPLAQRCKDRAYILSCGLEKGIAATKSVMEQALVLQFLLPGMFDQFDAAGLQECGALIDSALHQPVGDALIQKLEKASTIYFVGRDNGLNTELALKFSETCKNAVSHTGTDIIHGPQETMKPDDVVILIDPSPAHADKFQDVLVNKTGAFVIALSEADTIFPTIKIGGLSTIHPAMKNYLYLAMGWNLLIRLGTQTGIDIDHPKRAQKVGYLY